MLQYLKGRVLQYLKVQQLSLTPLSLHALLGSSIIHAREVQLELIMFSTGISSYTVRGLSIGSKRSITSTSTQSRLQISNSRSKDIPSVPQMWSQTSTQTIGQGYYGEKDFNYLPPHPNLMPSRTSLLSNQSTKMPMMPPGSETGIYYMPIGNVHVTLL